MANITILHLYLLNRPFSHSTSLRTNNSTRARLGWTFSYIYCIFVHPDLDLALLFVGMRERSIYLLLKALMLSLDLISCLESAPVCCSIYDQDMIEL